MGTGGDQFDELVEQLHRLSELARQTSFRDVGPEPRRRSKALLQVMESEDGEYLDIRIRKRFLSGRIVKTIVINAMIFLGGYAAAVFRGVISMP